MAYNDKIIVRSKEMPKKMAQTEIKKQIIRKGVPWFIVIILLGVIIFETALLTCRPKPDSFVADTSSYITVPFAGKWPPPIPQYSTPKKGTGRAYPVHDTFWNTLVRPLPRTVIEIVDYRNEALKILATTPVTVEDSTYHQTYSGVWFAPGGFQIRFENDSLVVDTFPRYIPERKVKEKKWHWMAGIGGEYLAYDTSFSTFTLPYLKVGGRLGPLRLGRTSVSIIPVQLKLVAGNSTQHGVAAAGIEVLVEW